MRKLNVMIFFLLTGVLLLLIGGLFVRNNLSEKVAIGTTLEKQDVAGLTKQELKTVIEKRMKELKL